MRNQNFIKFVGIIEQSSNSGAYIKVPLDIKKEFNKGRLKVIATFDGIEYIGSVVNMGVKNSDGTTCYIIGILKDIRARLNKGIGDNVDVVIIPVQE